MLDGTSRFQCSCWYRDKRNAGRSTGKISSECDGYQLWFCDRFSHLQEEMQQHLDFEGLKWRLGNCGMLPDLCQTVDHWFTDICNRILNGVAPLKSCHVWKSLKISQLLWLCSAGNDHCSWFGGERLWGPTIEVVVIYAPFIYFKTFLCSTLFVGLCKSEIGPCLVQLLHVVYPTCLDLVV